MTNQIYFDNAASTPLLPEVRDTMVEIMDNYNGNPSSIHAHGRQAKAQIEKARKIVAESMGASIGEIFFTSSATESNNAILRNCVKNHNVKRIITSPIEHPCVINTCQALGKEDEIELILLSVDSEGNISLDELEEHLKDNQKTLVSLMYGNNEIGTINPIKEISKICKKNKALLHSDAVQQIGKTPIDVYDLGVDFLSGTAHKFYGPKGSAFMFINAESQISAFHTGGAQERNMRAGTENTSGIVGLAKALEIAISEMESRKETILNLRNHMKAELQKITDDVQFNGVQEMPFLYHILSVSFPQSAKNDMLIYNLDIHNICASAGSACSSGTNTGSHVLAAIQPESLRNTIRFSFSHLNTKEEVDTVLEVLKKIL